jgi:hypothetical protein
MNSVQVFLFAIIISILSCCAAVYYSAKSVVSDVASALSKVPASVTFSPANTEQKSD